jgi:hypothetical protein
MGEAYARTQAGIRDPARYSAGSFLGAEPAGPYLRGTFLVGSE